MRHGVLSITAGRNIAIGPANNLWVADTENNRVDEFNEKGEFVRTFGKEVNKTKVVRRPIAPAAAPTP